MLPDISKPNIPKQNCFNLIRLLCCVIVIYEHAADLSGAPFMCFNLRGYAVRVFFILSGFWITASFLRSNSLKEYAAKRFKKIFPHYWTVVLFFAVILCLAGTLSAKDYFLNSEFWKYITANLLTLNFVKPDLPGVFTGLSRNGAVNGSLWTIKVEVGFYICLPFIMWLFNAAHKKREGGGMRTSF